MFMYDLIIKNGTVVSTHGVHKADIAINKDKIISIGAGFKAKDTIDAEGMLVLPGGVDVHTHMDMPFMSTVTADNFETGSIAAACGGTTSLIDFAMQSPGDSLQDTLLAWFKKAEGKSSIDFSFHIGMTEINEASINEIKDIVQKGITSIKLFMAYDFACNDREILNILKTAKKENVLTLFHAENGEIINFLTKKYLREGNHKPFYHKEAHPAIAEEEAAGRAIALSQILNTPIYIVHLSCKGALDKIIDARKEGLPVYTETCPQYLLLNEDKYNNSFNEASKFVCSPPLRGKTDSDALWNGLSSGEIQVISTDHCTFTTNQKKKGEKDFSKIPNGIGGVETRVPLIYSEGVKKGRLNLQRFVEVVCTNPARLFGMYPQKGVIGPGSDADIIIFDPKKEVTITNRNLRENTDYTPYEGFKVTGYPLHVLLRGETIVKEGEFIGKKRTGKFVRRKPFQKI